MHRIGRVQLVQTMLLVQALSSVPAEERIAFCTLLRDGRRQACSLFTARGGQAPLELLEQMSGLTKSDEAELAEIDVVERLAEIESHLIAGDLSQAVAAWDKNKIKEIAATRMSFPLLYALGQQLRFATESGEDPHPAFQQFLQVLGAVVFENSELLLDPQYRSMINQVVRSSHGVRSRQPRAKIRRKQRPSARSWHFNGHPA